MGTNNVVYPYAFIGRIDARSKFKGGEPALEIGNENIFREYVTAHVATNPEDATIIGSNNVLLAYSHVAHDCIVGDHLVMSSHSALGGHVEVEDFVNIGWGAGVHQFCKLVGIAWFRLVQNWFRMSPFLCSRTVLLLRLRSINKVGLERADFSADEIEIARAVFKKIYWSDLESWASHRFY